MTTEFKDIVCFLQPTGDSAFVTRHLVAHLGNRHIMFEHPLYDENENGYTVHESHTTIVVRLFMQGPKSEKSTIALRGMVSEVFFNLNVDNYLIWYNDPSALDWTQHLFPTTTVFHCTDLLSNYQSDNVVCDLIAHVDAIVTSGYSAYETLRGVHDNVFNVYMPLDLDHFYEARFYKKDPIDQILISHPRIGYFGPLDERFDWALLTALATTRPHWQFILLGESPHDLQATQFSNIHFLGEKDYRLLPDYISGWDVGLVPFHQEVARFSNPNQCQQFIAAGKPVVCTSIPDVIRSFGGRQLIHIAGTAADIISKIQEELKTRDRSEWHLNVLERLREKKIDSGLQQFLGYLSSARIASTPTEITEPALQRMG